MRPDTVQTGTVQAVTDDAGGAVDDGTGGIDSPLGDSIFIGDLLEAVGDEGDFDVGEVLRGEGLGEREGAVEAAG